MDTKLVAILGEHFTDPPDGWSDDITFESLAADSLTVLDLCISIENEYGFDIPDEDILRDRKLVMGTVGDLRQYIARRTSCPA